MFDPIPPPLYLKYIFTFLLLENETVLENIKKHLLPTPAKQPPSIEEVSFLEKKKDSTKEKPEKSKFYYI